MDPLAGSCAQHAAPTPRGSDEREGADLAWICRPPTASVATRTILSRHGFRRLYQHATHRARGDLAHLQLRGPHDLRHSFSTWLEDDGIPARVIDELMGHQRSRRGELEGASRIGARYRHTTPEMAARVIQALDTRLTLTLQIAEAITPPELDQGDRVFSRGERHTSHGRSTTQLLAGSPTGLIEPR